MLIIIALFNFIGSRTNPDGIYTDPNNGDRVAENYGAEPEVTEKSVTITGRSELLTQGLSLQTVNTLNHLFLDYNPDIRTVSIVTKSVTQYRDNPNKGFSYSFEVQIDRKDYFKTIIETNDSDSGTMKLLSKNGETLLKEITYSPETYSDHDHYAEGDGE